MYIVYIYIYIYLCLYFVLNMLFVYLEFVTKIISPWDYSSISDSLASLLYCHSATCVDIQWNEMSCLTGPRCYINTDIQHYKNKIKIKNLYKTNLLSDFD